MPDLAPIPIAIELVQYTPRRDGMVRLLNAEASDDRKFATAEMIARLHACRQDGHVRGPIGFASQSEVLAALLPGQDELRHLAVGLVYGEADRVNRESLRLCLDEAIVQCLGSNGSTTTVEQLPTAA